MGELDPRSPYTPQGDPFNDQDLRTRTVLRWICGCGINAADRILPLQRDLPDLKFRELFRPQQPAQSGLRQLALRKIHRAIRMSLPSRNLPQVVTDRMG
jgi:hypothetical protein